MPNNNNKTGKPDLKSRLGKKRLRTASQKGLKQQTGTQAPAGPPSSAGMPAAPSSTGMPVAPSSTGMPAVPSSTGMPVAPSNMPMPTESALEVDFDAVAKKNKMTLILVAIVFGLPALGIGYCFGHRREQITIANQATDDAKPILENIKKVNGGLNKLYAEFVSPPDTYAGWLNVGKTANIPSPNLDLFAKAKINWIPLPKQRRGFMSNIVSYYTYVLLAQKEYASLQSFISTLQKDAPILKEIDKHGKKLIGEKWKEYFINFRKGIKEFEMKTLKEYNKKLSDKKAAKFLVLFQGSPQKSLIVPNIASHIKKVKICPMSKLACPKGKKNCDESVKTCKPNEKVEVKAYSYKGMYFYFNIENEKPFGKANIAVPFSEIAQRSLFDLVKYEIENPLAIRFQQAIMRFYKLKSYLKKAREMSGKIVPIIEKASKRKKRSFI